ncbi:hypothetical protein REPUB_Repub05bG0003800 [Reevesia pubescens]
MGRGDNRWIAIVVVDALTRRLWVREEDLAKELKLHSKQLQRILRLFEEEKLVTRDHRKERMDIAFTAAIKRGEEEMSVISLDEHLGDYTEEEINDFASWLGESYATDAMTALYGVLTIPLANDDNNNGFPVGKAQGH